MTCEPKDDGAVIEHEGEGAIGGPLEGVGAPRQPLELVLVRRHRQSSRIFDVFWFKESDFRRVLTRPLSLSSVPHNKQANAMSDFFLLAKQAMFGTKPSSAPASGAPSFYDIKETGWAMS